uniref:WRKY domain-containing protein n=1 Tax=Oryza punctata TaxID=4537 RepID=A0A0E0M019_ORYPU
MESMEGNGGGRLVVTELSHIKELVKQLEGHLGGSGSPDLCKHLASQIFSVTERSIGMIRSGHFDGPRKRAAATGDLDPATPSPLSDVSDLPFKATKKRKMSTEKKRHQIRVSSTGGVENPPVDDGHSWRKYGQKEILGSKHPRGYYRCTHRNSQGCMATKQVQRTDQDATLFDVIYHGEHTCVQKAVAAGAGNTQPETDTNAAQSHLHHLSSGLTVKVEGLTATEQPPPPPQQQQQQGGSWNAMPPFCLSSPVSGLAPPEHNPFSAPSTPENSPATSGSNHPSVAAPFHQVAGDAAWRDAELQEVVSALVAATTTVQPATAAMDADFSLDGFEFDPAFTIDITSFFT